ncbi:MAG: hypothetical protein WD334_04935 [Chitinophagales bacterium]
MRFISTFFYLTLTLFIVNVAYTQNVGVGTPMPLNRLDVNGGVTIGSGYSGSRIAPANGLIIEGNTGIGTYNPTSKLHVSTTSFGQIGLQGINSNSFGVGVLGTGGSISNPVFPQDSMSGLLEPYDPLFKYNGSIGGSFAGKVGLFSYTNATNGLGLISQHSDSLGYAAYFKGNTAVDGFIRNPGTKYGGSVSVLDGLTVGNLGNSGCSPNKPETCSFDNVNTEQFFRYGYTPTYDHYPVCDSGFCKSITDVEIELTMNAWHQMSINTRIFLRGTYVASIIAGPINAPGGHGNMASYTETFNSSLWNETDPSGLNWDMQFEHLDPAGGHWKSYNVTISYDFDDADSGTATYAAYGEIRASGTLYANSSSEYGDLAEFFDVKPRIGGRTPEIGDIVSISRDEDETFLLSRRAYDPLLAGVISENPSVYLNSPDEGMPIALSGRVRVKVNTESGAIEIGDPITSSSTEGVGMKSLESGMVIGHAMQAFDGSRAEEGKIWVLLGKTHIERVKDHTTVVQGKDFKLGGVQLSGTEKVNTGQDEVHVPWKGKIKRSLESSNIDFDAITVDLSSIGTAGLFVKNVDANGFTVGVHKKSRGKNFQGFHYSIKLIDPSLSGMDKQMVSNNKANQNNDIAYENMTFDHRALSAIEIYKKWNQSFDELLESSDLKEEFLNTTFTITKNEFTPLMNRIKKNAPKEYETYMSLGESLDAAIGGDTKIMAAIHNAVRE